MKKMLLGAVLTGMLALGITTSTEACPPIPPGIHTINRNHDHHFNKVKDKNPRRFVCGRDRRDRINSSTCRGSIRCSKKYDSSRFGCTRTTKPPQRTHNIHH